MKKTIYKSTLLAALGVVTLGATAQQRSEKDSTISRQVMLERDYNPSIKDASKINTLPAIYEPVVRPKSVSFIETAPQISLGNKQLGKAASGDINTDIAFSKKRGYLNLGAGTNSNIEGAAGYRILNSAKDQLDLFANHSSTSGDVDFVEKGYIMDKSKAKYSDSKINAKYMHAFDLSELFIDASFFNSGYNYYGNPFVSTSIMPLGYNIDMDTRQSVNVISVGAGLRSSSNSESLLKYSIRAGYDNFKNKYGINKNTDGVTGGIFKAYGDFTTPFDSDKNLGLNLSIVNQSFSNDGFAFKDGYHGFSNIGMSPYFAFEGEAWKAKLGVNLNAIFDTKTSFLLAPNISASYNVGEKSSFYGSIGSKVNNNLFTDILLENRYTNPQARIEFSKTFYDAAIGFKSGSLTGFEFDIFGGYKYTQKDHLYLPYSDYNKIAWSNVSIPVYANLSTGHFGGQIKTTLIPYTDLSLKVVGYFYSLKYKGSYAESQYQNLPTEKKAWGKPNITAELNADVKPIPQLTLSMNFQYAGGRKTFAPQPTTTSVVEYASTKMKDINELSFRAEYQIQDWISINARLNNVLNQHYELQPGYALQGFNALAGFSIKF